MEQEHDMSDLIEEESHNVYAKVGQDYLKVIEKIVKDINQPDKSYLFETLDCMQLEEGYSLGLRLAEHKGMGDESWFFTYQKHIGPEEYLNKLDFITAKFEDRLQLDHIFVQKTEMGAWQAYLYSIAITLLPVYWHGGYIMRKYVFMLDDLANIFIDANSEALLHLRDFQGRVSPEVMIQGDKATIQVCFWNEWRGLVRDTVEIRFEGNRVVSFECVKTEVLIEYNCGILF